MHRKIGFISLGCPKNRVDTEIMLAHLESDGWCFTYKIDEAEVIVVNTCAFIEPAREEAVEAILEAAEMKKRGKCRRLVVTGCMVNRYRDELEREIPEIDAMVDTFSLPSIVNAVKDDADIKLYTREISRADRQDITRLWSAPRILTTPSHYAYLKIADGCNHKCTFCAIPLIKGIQTSRNSDDILKEAEGLAKKGVKELILISQDSSGWGKDLTPEEEITGLLRTLDGEKLFHWIRLMYLFPSGIDNNLLETVASSNSILPYFDIPLQHSHPEILKKMGRSGNAEKHLNLLNRIRSSVPRAVFRSSFIVGSPGETDSTIEHLEKFLSDARIDNVGIFTYSNEEGTAAAEKYPDKIPQKIKSSWQKRLMQHQKKVSREILKSYKDSVLEVIIDGHNPETGEGLIGRFYGQTPEIDGMVIITDSTANPGDIVSVKIEKTWDYDLKGTDLTSFK